MRKRCAITPSTCDRHVIERIAISLAGVHPDRASEPGAVRVCGNRQQRVFSRQRNAFTLVELLVVVGIISLLTTILLPSLVKAKGLAYSVKCLVHLRGLGQACRMYAWDNGERLPSTADSESPALAVRTALRPFISSGKMFLCLRDPEDPPLPEGSYDWRFTDDSECSLAGVALHSISQPASVILGGDRQLSWHKQDWINVVFADTHAKSVTEDAWFANLSLPVR